MNAREGAEFPIEYPDGSGNPLLTRMLSPLNQTADRGPQSFELRLPDGATGQIKFSILPGPQNNSSFDWTYWEDLQFEIPQS
ncbi:MAG: hypothetical protein A3G75_06550 [Verrucomicrobia bacterium RIFCSPLOWO2_12_FULL_64_8]|nr:MAG: hypothetical protein A3G75_06550 [Verrucomicrobia bacterium RIFCSPLOWO2_12_FULL_64_8]